MQYEVTQRDHWIGLFIFHQTISPKKRTTSLGEGTRFLLPPPLYKQKNVKEYARTFTSKDALCYSKFKRLGKIGFSYKKSDATQKSGRP
jgi:hypothetical protein